MLANYLSRNSALVSQSVRSFGRTPMIQFLGPRSKTDKSVGMYASAAGHGAAESADDDRANKKAISRDCELEFADIPADRWRRIPFTDLEMDIINQGTNDVEVDWRNIRLWRIDEVNLVMDMEQKKPYLFDWLFNENLT